MPTAVFILDFDGVIVDSLAALYNVYNQFLNTYGFHGTPEEFDHLNGPSLQEIMVYLKGKYQLEDTPEELLVAYHKRLSNIYTQAPLMNGVRLLMKSLCELGIPLIIGSSSMRVEIEQVLERLDLRTYVEHIVSGDDVEYSKPNPAIYHKAMAFYPDAVHYIVEDSDHGMEAAWRAGGRVIFYNPNQRSTPQPYHATVSHHVQIWEWVKHLAQGGWVLAKASQIHVTKAEEPFTPSAQQRTQVDTLWAQALTTRDLFDGQVAVYHRQTLVEERLDIQVQVVPYRYVFAQLQDPSIGLNLYPIGVSALVLGKMGHLLVGRRQKTTEYEGCLECVPSGGLDAKQYTQGQFDVPQQLLEELEEETGIPSEAVEGLQPLGLIFDTAHGVYDVGYSLRLQQSLAAYLEKQDHSEEYSTLEAQPYPNLWADATLIPTSRALLRLLADELPF